MSDGCVCPAEAWCEDGVLRVAMEDRYEFVVIVCDVDYFGCG